MIKKSPFTGGEVELRKKQSSVQYKDRTITYEMEFYHCVDTGHEFTDAETDQRNLDRMWKQINILNAIENEGVTFVREIEPGTYIIQTEKVWKVLKEKVRNGEINSGFNAFVPDYVRELNEKSKTPEGQEEILRKLWGEDWKNHVWGE